MRKNTIWILVLVLLLCLSGCGKKPYSETDFIGLSSQEITNKYGNFDNTRDRPSPDGLYRNCGCGYLVTEATNGLFGTPSEYFMIYFDENGIAYRCAYEEGGIGG